MPSPKSPYTDEQLLQGIRQQDREVLRFFYREYRPLIRLMVYRMGGNPEDAKDVFQEGLILLLRMVENPSFRLTSSMATLLYSICRTQFKYRLRISYKTEELDPEKHLLVEEPDFPESEEKSEYEKIVWSAFQKLPRSCRTILNLHLMNYMNSEIARLLNMTEGYVRKRKSDCTRKMIANIRKRGEYQRLLGIVKSKHLLKQVP